MDIDISTILVTSDQTIKDLIECIDSAPCKIAVLIDQDSRLLDTLTDGDVRRALIKGLSLDSQISEVQTVKSEINPNGPVFAIEGTSKSQLLSQMHRTQVRHIPIIDHSKKLTGIVVKDELLPAENIQLQAVVMAGGEGRRLRPLTDNMPKPMLPLGDKPILERIVTQLRDSGIQHINVTTHYKHEMITDYFGDGSSFGVNINYLEEDQPLGTAGALKHVPDSGTPILVMNGDVLTDVNFQAMLDFHVEQNADMTVAVAIQKIEVPYGVVDTDGLHIINIKEKPVLQHFVNAGVYLINPCLFDYIPESLPFDMPDLISTIIEAKLRVISFPVHEYWVDIGKHSDYEQAMIDLEPISTDRCGER